MFNIFHGKSQVTETVTIRITAIRIGCGIGAAEVQKFNDELARLMNRPPLDSGDGLEERSVKRRLDRLLESEDLKKLPASFKISNDNREVIDLFYQG
ncbi:MAG: hypothetical protein M0Z89_00935 [Nitrospiraceae bacterium]|nr:hypothetical protein [Nitrospiraceae bacterium]